MLQEKLLLELLLDRAGCGEIRLLLPLMRNCERVVWFDPPWQPHAAALAAAASAQLPLTLRGVASTLVFATGHNANSETLPEWAGLALKGATVAVYMGRTVAAAVAEKLVAAGMRPDTPVAIIENAAHPDERQFTGALAELFELSDRPEIDGPVLIVIGEAVGHAALEKAEPIAAPPLKQEFAA